MESVLWGMKESHVGSSVESLKVDVGGAERLDIAAKRAGLDQDVMGIWDQIQKQFV